jgi:uncharacterized phage infection (PIP) family protein YhgE
MVTTVVVLNTLIALICLYVARKIWKLRKQLGKVADTLTSAERSAHATLYSAPKAIYKGQKGIAGLEERYQGLESQLQRVQKVLGLVSLGQKFWQQQKGRRSKIREKPRRLRS